MRAWLVILDEGPGNGLFVRTKEDKPIVWDREKDQPRPFDDPNAKPALKGVVTLASGQEGGAGLSSSGRTLSG